MQYLRKNLKEGFISQLKRIIEADIFSLDGIPVIPINLQGIHGKGLANEAYKKKLIFYRTDKEFKFNGKAVCFPTKIVWTEKADYDLMKDSFSKLIILANGSKEFIFNLPLVGLGYGEGNPKIIIPMIMDCLMQTENVRLVLSEPNAKKIQLYVKLIHEYIEKLKN
jgi:hypothetical protein